MDGPSKGEIYAQIEIANGARKSATTDTRFAHVGFLRAAPYARPGKLGIRFYPTGDLLGQRCDHGALWESVAVVDLIPTMDRERELLADLDRAIDARRDARGPDVDAAEERYLSASYALQRFYGNS